MTQCQYPGCNASVSKPGHKYCLKHWKEVTHSADAVNLTPPDVPLLSVTRIGQRLQPPLSGQAVNRILAELDWIRREQGGWAATERGVTRGAVQKIDPKSNTSFVMWPENLLTNSVFLKSTRNASGESETPAPAPHAASTTGTASAESDFRSKFPAEHRTVDGHMVRSRAEVMIDNWLYMAGIVHAYERRLPIEEDVYCDFYLPAGKVYIEYWGLEHEPTYAARKQAKQEIYRKYGLNLLELTDEHIRSLDDVLPRLLLKYHIVVND